jgi:hypothetical protein
MGAMMRDDISVREAALSVPTDSEKYSLTTSWTSAVFFSDSWEIDFSISLVADGGIFSAKKPANIAMMKMRTTMPIRNGTMDFKMFQVVENA